LVLPGRVLKDRFVMNLKDALEARASVWDKMKALRDVPVSAGRSTLTPSEAAEFRSLEADLERFTGEIEKIQSSDAFARTLTPNFDGEGVDDSRACRPLGEQRMADWAQQRGLVREEERSLDFGRYIRGVSSGDWKGADPERRAMAEGTMATGGFMVPTLLSTQIIDLARNKAQVLRAGASVFPMENSQVNVARWSVDPVPAWHGENTLITNTDAAVQQVILRAQSLAVLTTVSRELVEDTDEATGASVTDALKAAFASQMALSLDTAALYGTGAPPMPLGIKNTAGVTVVPMATNGAAPTNYDWLINAVGTLRGFNEEPNAVIYSPRTEQELATLKDTQGRYLDPPVALATIPTYTTNQIGNAFTVGTGTTTSDAFIGDWSQLYVGMRTEFQIQVLAERYVEFGQIGFLGWLRADIAVARPKAFVVETGLL